MSDEEKSTNVETPDTTSSPEEKPESVEVPSGQLGSLEISSAIQESSTEAEAKTTKEPNPVTGTEIISAPDEVAAQPSTSTSDDVGSMVAGSFKSLSPVSKDKTVMSPSKGKSPGKLGKKVERMWDSTKKWFKKSPEKAPLVGAQLTLSPPKNTKEKKEKNKLAVHFFDQKARSRMSESSGIITESSSLDAMSDSCFSAESITTDEPSKKDKDSKMEEVSRSKEEKSGMVGKDEAKKEESVPAAGEAKKEESVPAAGEAKETEKSIES